MFLERDSDGDGLLDGLEATVFKTDPNNPDSAFLVDRTGDGQPDYPGRGGNNLVDGDEDLDGDGLSNLTEIRNGTDPFVAQNNGVDSDADGLPDWAEDLIFAYQGISNPGRRDDSDGDSVDNYTEVALGTDPSWPDAVFTFNFSNLPDAQRVVVFPPMTLNRASANPSVTTNHIFDTAGTLGTYLHVEVRRDRDADDLPAPGQDTLLFLGAYLTPISGYGMEMLMDGSTLTDAYIDTSDLLITGTSLFATIWEEANVSDAIDQFPLLKLQVLQQRAMLRMVMRMRELQLTIDMSNGSAGTQMRIRTLQAKMHTEMTVFRRTTVRITQLQGNNWATKAGFWVSGAGRLASIFSIYNAADGVYNAALPFITDVRRRCDNYGDTAGDLAVALGNLASEQAPIFNVGNFWSVYWVQLNRFDGFDTPCF